MPNQRVHRFVSNDFTLRAAAVDATDVVREMQKLQQTMPLPTVAVGRAMVGALLLASHLKEEQQVGLLFKGNGGLAHIYAEAHFEGKVRGYTPTPLYEPPDYSQGLVLGPSVGRGTLSVARHLPFQKQPHHGTVELVSGEIGDDIAHYLIQSHQIRSVVSLGVYLDTYGKVISAGGVMVEVMPGVEEEIVKKIEANALAQKKPISELLKEGFTAQDLVKPYLLGINYTELDHDYPMSYSCPCNEERVIRALEVMGVAELEDMIAKNEEADVTCQMCGKPYQIPVVQLEAIKEDLRKNSMH